MGSGIWATHFVAMLAFHAPIALRYDLPITGLSLLLLFVAMAQLIGWPQERGIVTIWIAHTSFCSSYVAVVVSARLRELDLSIEEAAMDLGAKPWKVFLLITIPMIAPSLAAGGMMSF
ncbi:MHYT domain-containing protein, partial [Salmonella sp. M265]|uniref:MHYT domain-containing protein n=1 Tax=Salmonella sp. M265 TaxID=3240301 RepID=UPI00352A9371